jgi:hypothetical protein
VLAGRLTGGAALKTPIGSARLATTSLHDFGKIAKYGL